jgi:arsenate reductase-like glutaredoxin family protein
VSCTRAQEFLVPKSITQPEHLLANKIKIHQAQAIALARESSAVWVTKGKKLIKLDPVSAASDEALAKLILGRSGTLRAPAFRAGEVFMVGFSEVAYGALFD